MSPTALTQSKSFSGFRRQVESDDGQHRDEDARQDQVESVEESLPFQIEVEPENGEIALLVIGDETNRRSV